MTSPQRELSNVHPIRQDCLDASVSQHKSRRYVQSTVHSLLICGFAAFDEISDLEASLAVRRSMDDAPTRPALTAGLRRCAAAGAAAAGGAPPARRCSRHFQRWGPHGGAADSDGARAAGQRSKRHE